MRTISTLAACCLLTNCLLTSCLLTSCLLTSCLLTSCLLTSCLLTGGMLTGGMLTGGMRIAAAEPAAAATFNLAKIDRTIDRQPQNQTDSPKYCLLVFGPHARTRVWIVLDGDSIYVERNGNRDLTEPGERIVRSDSYTLDLGSIVESDRQRTHTQLKLSGKAGDRYRMSIMVNGQQRQLVGRDVNSKPRFDGDSPANVPMLNARLHDRDSLVRMRAASEIKGFGSDAGGVGRQAARPQSRRSPPRGGALGSLERLDTPFPGRALIHRFEIPSSCSSKGPKAATTNMSGIMPYRTTAISSLVGLIGRRTSMMNTVAHSQSRATQNAR